MKLFEYEAKQIFAKYGIPLPRGGLAKSSEEAREIAAQINASVVVKAQVLIAGRAKAGGIIFANTPDETKQAATKLLNARIGGAKVRSLWIEEKIPIKQELYFGLTVDRANRSYLMITSSEGGMEIEEVAASSPEKLVRILIDPVYGLRSYHARQIAKKLGYAGNQMFDLASIFLKLCKLTFDYDAELTEINPLIEKPDGKFVAVDAHMMIDENALYRHPEFRDRPLEEEGLTPQELEARKSGLAYVRLDGDVGVIGNGAGLVMATLDTIKLYGGSPANFLDVGGGASAGIMAKALDVILSDARVKVVFINILGGITRCDEIANGILAAQQRVGFDKPMVVRLVGTNEEEGRRILAKAGIPVLDSMEEAAAKVVELSRSKG